MKLCKKDSPYRQWLIIGILVALLIDNCAEDSEQVEFIGDLFVLMGGLLIVLSYE